MLNKKLVSVALAVCTFLLAFAFGSQQAEGIQALPPAPPSAPNAGSAAAAAVSRSHLTPAIVYVASGGHIHEIALKGTWQDRDLTVAASAPLSVSGLSKPMAFRRSDGVSMVVYRGKDARAGHILALYLELARQGGGFQEVWHWADLTEITGAALATSDPYGYNRSDGISAVIYHDLDGNIHELRLDNGWQSANLTALSSAPKSANSRPVAYVRGDGVNAIVYKAALNEHIIELHLGENGWKWTDLTGPTGAPRPFSELTTYVRSDGISTINYGGYDGHVHDLRLENDWIHADMTDITGAPGTSTRSFGYVRSDGLNAIVYATATGQVYELWLDNGWHDFELTSIPDAVPGYKPVGYVRADGIDSVVYIGGGVWHVQEIWLGTDGWHWADLSDLGGGLALDSYPWPYNRSAVSRVYLPYVRR